VNRERILKVVLIVVGLLFLATVYPLVTFLWQETHATYAPMMLSLYVTLGIFLLIASRNPSAHRSLISFAAWSNLAHAAVMIAQSVRDIEERPHLLIGSLACILIAVALLSLSPATHTP
jgi:hypothetical protein